MGELNIQHNDFDRTNLPTVFKNIDTSDLTVTPFNVYKSWVAWSGSSTSSCLPLNAIYSDINYLPYLGTELIYNDSKNVDNSLQTVSYYSINRLFYKNKRNLYFQLGPLNTNTNRVLYQSASILSFPYNKVGNEIKPESFYFQSETGSIGFNLSTDKYGNIYNLQLNSNKIISNCKFYEGFNEYFDLSRIPNSPDLSNVFAMQDRYITGSILISEGIKTTSGQQKSIGYSAQFTSNGYLVVPNDFILGSYGIANNYAVSFFISASSTGTGNQSVINKFAKQGPYDIRVLPNKKIAFYIHGNTYNINNTPIDSAVIYVTSSTAVSSSWNHVVCQKSGSYMQIYVNGSLQSNVNQAKLIKSNSPYSHSFNINTNADLKIGGVGFTNTSLNYTGKLDEVRIYNKALTSTEVGYLRDLHETGSMLQTTQVGNIFNKQGIAVITSPNYIYDNILQTPYSASYKSTVVRHELSTVVRIPSDEFNLTTNPSAIEDDYSSYKSYVTSSNFDPYFTTIGLYNDSAQLLAIAKLAYPIKKRGDVDINVLVRLDLDMSIK
jgi:hypothetical protein